MLIILMLRQIFSKTSEQPAHHLTDGYIWYDKNYGSGQTFMGYTIFDTNTKWFNYCTKRNYGPDRTVIALAPSGNSIVEAVKTTLNADLASYGFTVKTYASRDEIWSTLSSSSYELDGVAGICFGAVLTASSTNNYQVNMIFDDILSTRSNSGNMPNQQLDSADKYQRSPNMNAWKQYKQGGYTYLQNIISNAILRAETGSSGAYISMIYTPLKSGFYVSDDFSTGLVNTWNFFILLVYLAPLYRFVSNSVSEKETKIREAMKIMGLTDAPYWLSWFTYYIIINTIQASIMTIILIPVFEYSDRGFVFLYLWFYGMTMFGYGVLVGSFFSNGKTAAIFATMLFYLTSFINMGVSDQSVSESAKIICSFFPAVAVQLGGINLLQFESSGIGLHSSNISEVYKNYKFSTCLWMNVVSFFTFLLLGLYLENVLPAAVGVRKPLWYLFTKSYWCGVKHESENHNKDEHKSGDSKIMSSDRLNELEADGIPINPEYFEEVPEYLRQKEEEQR